MLVVKSMQLSWSTMLTLVNTVQLKLLAVVDIMHLAVVNVPMEPMELCLGEHGAMENVAG